MGGLFSSTSNASQNESADEMEDLGAMLNKLTAVESAGPLEQVSEGVKIMENVNELMWNTIHAHHRTMSDSRRRNSIDEILDAFYKCNEKTLDVLDSIATHKAELEDCVAFSTAVGQLLVTDPTNAEGIKSCIIRAKNILQTGSHDILPNVKEEILRCLKAYDDLGNEIKIMRNELKLMQDEVQFQKYSVIVQVAAVAATFMIVGAVVCGLPAVVIGSGIAGAVVAAPDAYAVWGELTRREQRIQAIRDVLKGIELQRSEVRFTKSDVDHLYTSIVQVERRIQIADDVTNSSTVDQDLMKERGHELIALCDRMDNDFKALEVRIQFLRTQVVKVQRSRYYKRRRN